MLVSANDKKPVRKIERFTYTIYEKKKKRYQERMIFR